MSDGNPRSNAEIADDLKWDISKVYRVRRQLEERGVLKSEKKGRYKYYILVASVAAPFLILYGIMDVKNKKLQKMVLAEQEQRISGDVYLEQRLTEDEIKFTSLIDELAERQNLDYQETQQLISALQNKDVQIEQEMLLRYNLTQADINRLRTTVNMNDMYYKSKFYQQDIESGMTREALGIQSQRLSTLEAQPRITYSPTYKYYDKDKQDTSKERESIEDYIDKITKPVDYDTQEDEKKKKDWYGDLFGW